jgi:hypothetical protein
MEGMVLGPFTGSHSDFGDAPLFAEVHSVHRERLGISRKMEG